jgi:N-acetylglutamate synthase-like GNAT family acetyltransferase
MKFYKSKASTLDWLEKFYAACGYGGSFNDSDDVYFAEQDSTVLGVVRIAKEQGVFVLRGMQVLPEFRGHHLGRKLLSYLTSQISALDSPCFCLPHDHLVSFYSEAGFTPVMPSHISVPDFLHQRQLKYMEKNLNISVLVRIPAS